MPREEFTVERASGDITFRELTETKNAVGSTEPIRIAGDVALQITGDATAITCRVERATLDPGVEANWGPAGDDIVGDASAGIGCQMFREPTRAWWRVKVTAIAGGSVNIVLSGEKA